MPPKKRSGSTNRPFKLLLFLLLGAAAGWYLAPPKQQKEFQDIAQQATKDFPGALQRLKRALPAPPTLGGIGAFFGNIPQYLGRYYDDYIPADFRDTLAEGLPAAFAYPYICKIERVYRTSDGQSSKSFAVPALMNGMNMDMRADTVIRPGLTLLATRPEFGADIACRNLKIALASGTQVKFLRGTDSQKVLEVRGGALLRSEGKTSAGFSFPWGEVGLKFSEQPSEVRYRVTGSRPVLEVGSGQVEFSWEARASQVPPQELLHLFASPSAGVKIRHILSGTETLRELGPKRQASLLSNGQVSGAVGAIRSAAPAG